MLKTMHLYLQYVHFLIPPVVGTLQKEDWLIGKRKMYSRILILSLLSSVCRLFTDLPSGMTLKFIGSFKLSTASSRGLSSCGVVSEDMPIINVPKMYMQLWYVFRCYFKGISPIYFASTSQLIIFCGYKTQSFMVSSAACKRYLVKQ